jgi:hypothetical protein
MDRQCEITQQNGLLALCNFVLKSHQPSARLAIRTLTEKNLAVVLLRTLDTRDAVQLMVALSALHHLLGDPFDGEEHARRLAATRDDPEGLLLLLNLVFHPEPEVLCKVRPRRWPARTATSRPAARDATRCR